MTLDADWYEGLWRDGVLLERWTPCQVQRFGCEVRAMTPGILIERSVETSHYLCRVVFVSFDRYVVRVEDPQKTAGYFSHLLMHTGLEGAPNHPGGLSERVARRVVKENAPQA